MYPYSSPRRAKPCNSFPVSDTVGPENAAPCRHRLQFGEWGGMEGQKTRVKNEMGETREQSSLRRFCFDTCNRGYSFSSNFTLRLTE